MSSFADEIQSKYGPLLSVEQLAELLKRSPNALRVALHTSGSWATQMNSTKIRLGRRIYFRTSEVAHILSAQA